MEKVRVIRKCAKEIFDMNVHIPEYQRAYCWNSDSVIAFLKQLSANTKKKYYLGSIILHKTQNEDYDIVDGQQRLVTLSLILSSLGYNAKLMNERIRSAESMRCIGVNKRVIREYLNRYSDTIEKESVLHNVIIDMVILNSDSLELAYTFFSNQNSKGKPLTDFDLLKAHHLRFIESESQAIHLSTNWDALTSLPENKCDIVAEHLFRIRKWQKMQTWDESEKYRLKKEFVAAKVFDEIPAYTTSISVGEYMVGGARFFDYFDYFIKKYSLFRNCLMIKNDHKTKKGRKPQYVLDRTGGEYYLLDTTYFEPFIGIIETLLFAYYLKFGDKYLPEAFVLLSRIVSAERYRTAQISTEKVMSDIARTALVNIIEFAPSPTFCLKAFAEKIDNLPLIQDEYNRIVKKSGKKGIGNIILRYQSFIQGLVNSAEPLLSVDEIRNNYTQQK